MLNHTKLIIIIFLGSVCLSRNLSASKMTNIATYEEVKDLPNHPEKLLIDVREPNELQETGQIPTSINIPCKYEIFCKNENKIFGV
jgi:3-mercaptopyruvate sulfurtransferase SseA